MMACTWHKPKIPGAGRLRRLPARRAAGAGRAAESGLRPLAKVLNHSPKWKPGWQGSTLAPYENPVTRR